MSIDIIPQKQFPLFVIGTTLYMCMSAFPFGLVFSLLLTRAVIVDRDIDVSTIWGFRYITDSKFWSIDTIQAYSHT